MLKRATILLLVVLLASYAAPVSAQTSTEEELTAQFTAELNDYASTHSEEETRVYAQSWFGQVTSSSIPDPEQTTTLANFISPGVLFGGEDTGDLVTSIDLDLDREFNFSDKYRTCVTLKSRQCLDTYHHEVLTASAIAAGIFAGCNAITALSGFIACTVAASVSYLLMVQAAWDKCDACYRSAPWECKKELGLL